ncbi:hypothetical protein TNCV_1149811 [Trichonephila clavipes]|nr:hypothetical protein TNCV_1149811 [Trichonephila clavipes]
MSFSVVVTLIQRHCSHLFLSVSIPVCLVNKRLSLHPTGRIIVVATTSDRIESELCVTHLKTLASTCELAEQENGLIPDHIVMGIKDSGFQELLLRENNSLEKAIEIVRVAEASWKPIQNMKPPRTIIEERERKEVIELDVRKRKEERELAERKIKEEIELAERKRKEEMEIAERKRRADFEQRMRNVEMEFETQKKLIELEGEGHFARACLDIEVSTDRGNVGNEVRSNLSSETRLKVEVEGRLKDDKEAKAVEEGRKMKEE